jgi:hypothetical protein
MGLHQGQYMPLMPLEAVSAINSEMLQCESQELDYRIDICSIANDVHTEHLFVKTETWSVSPSVDMFPLPGHDSPGYSNAGFRNPVGT